MTTHSLARALRWPCLALCLAVLFGCATRDDVLTIYNRVVALEKRQDTLRSQVATLEVRADDLDARLKSSSSDAQSIREQAARTRVLAQEIQSELARTRGQLEETQHVLGVNAPGGAESPEDGAAGNLSEKMDLLIRRLIRVESFLGLEPEAAPTAPTAPADPGAAAPAPAPAPMGPVEATESDLYNRAKQALDAGSPAEARELFTDFLDKFPKSGNADNAMFWIGETYYQEKLFPKSILEYQKVIEKYPKGNKVPAALLKQGMAFFELKDQGNARLMWNELIRRFPKSKEAGIAKKKMDSIKG